MASFLTELDKYEELEERDRLAHGAQKNEGKKKRKPVQKKITSPRGDKGSDKKAQKMETSLVGKETVKETKKGEKKGEKKTENKKTENKKTQPKIKQQDPEDLEDLPLMERIRRKNQAEGREVAHHVTTTSVV